MKIEKTIEDEFHWRSVFKYRERTNDFIIERKSSKYPRNNHHIHLDAETVKQFVNFAKKMGVG